MVNFNTSNNATAEFVMKLRNVIKCVTIDTFTMEPRKGIPPMHLQGYLPLPSNGGDRLDRPDSCLT